MINIKKIKDNSYLLSKDGKSVEVCIRPDQVIEAEADSLFNIGTGVVAEDMSVHGPDFYIDQARRAEYPSIEKLTIALWKHIVENTSTELDALQEKRQAVKDKYPKS